MSVKCNLRHLERHSLHLQGQVTVAELDIDIKDEAIQLLKPLEYDMTVELLEGGMLAQGRLRLPLQCHCVRCLKAFEQTVELPRWSLHLPLEGEDAVPLEGDCVDLTPFLREDILLEFPQHPLCEQECKGLRRSAVESPARSGSGQIDPGSSAWTELNKLKF